MSDEPTAFNVSQGHTVSGELKSWDFRDHGKTLLWICKDHLDKLTGEECPYCRIALLEKACEAAEEVYEWLGIGEFDCVDTMGVNLVAAGYLKGEGND
jgi:hypothetical protein